MLFLFTVIIIDNRSHCKVDNQKFLYDYFYRILVYVNGKKFVKFVFIEKN